MLMDEIIDPEEDKESHRMHISTWLHNNNNNIYIKQIEEKEKKKKERKMVTYERRIGA